ncbi:hypothetical protein QA601_12620 [Chitinispirillales bacterium ANBcel5]|uniref:vWA domain-containing protein n=1 Tax=Cellulosispirillum alkaliphilum TaxID=3039283 RepID=UPI002A554606|nr:hypothetical protein [Chitinispirillales bacterium ANBcel5]
MNQIRTQVVTICVLLGICAVFVVNADKLCEARVDCPLYWDRDTVRVAEDVVVLSAQFDHCSPDSIHEGGGFIPGQTDTVSVFFVIDQSGSMAIMDSTNERYRLTRALIDTIYERSPASEVGVAVFANQLLHSHEDDPFYVQLNQKGDWHDSYVPLTRLNDSVGEITGREKVKSSIELSDTERDIRGLFKLVNGNYDNTGRSTYLGEVFSGSTDITLGFEAAREAFKTAANPPDRQFIIFLSDGEAQNVDDEREEYIFDYIAGDGLPTTFTAFFVNVRQPIPESLQDMTENIRQNDYSSSNPRSSIWLQSSNQEGLIDNFLTELSPWIEPDMGYYRSTPVAMTINGVDALSFDDNDAHFSQPFFPLQGKYTQMDISYTYEFETTSPPFQRTREFSVVVKQSENPDVETVTCWSRDSIGVYHRGNKIYTVEEAMKNLEVRYYPLWEEKDSVDLLVKNSSSTDSLTLNLFNRGSYWSGEFAREYGPPKDDNILQTESGDSLIIIYRNPVLPLDTIRTALPIVPQRDLEVKEAYYLDTKGDGHPDVIKIIQSTERLNAQECSLIVESLSLRTDRNITIESVTSDPDGFLVNITSNDSVPFTGLYPGERLFVSRTEMPSGGFFPHTEVAIADSMAPVIVEAIYYDVEGATDTLVVTFSEHIEDIDTEQPFVFEQNAQQYIQHVKQREREGKTVTFTVLSSVAALSPQAGDSVRINTESPVSDTIENLQRNPMNRNVMLDYRIYHSAVNAYYYDQSRDGFIDLISITTDRKLDSLTLQDFISSITLPAHREFSFSDEDVVLTDSGFTIKVKQGDVEPQTGVDSKDVLSVAELRTERGVIISEANISIKDRMAPIITDALFIPSDDDDELKDTLVLQFSEEVETSFSLSPFTFFDSEGEQYTMDLKFEYKNSEGGYVFSVIEIIGTPFPALSDSITIDPSSNITDRAQNVQDSSSRISPLTVQPHPQDFRLLVYPNPFFPGKSDIPESVRQNYGLNNRNGIVAIVEPLSRASIVSGIKAQFTVYDALGNVVDKGEGTVGTENRVYHIWNARRNNRQSVGTGTYLIIVEITDLFEQSSVKSAKVGVINN